MSENPWNREMERAVLGSLLLDNSRYYDVASDLSADDFYLNDHRGIYLAIVELMESGQPAERLAVHQLLQQSPNGLKQISISELMELSDGVVECGIGNYVARIKELAQRRRLMSLCETAMQRAQYEPLNEIVEELQDKSLDIMADSAQNKTQKLRQILPAVFDNFNRLASWALGEKIIGLPTGLPKLDKFLSGGYRRKEYYVCGGYAGDGKTSFAMMTILEAIRLQWPVLYFSHEMDREAVAHRLLAATTKVNFAHLRDPREMEMFEWDELKAIRPQLESWPLWVEDSGSMEIGKLRAVARMHIRRHGVIVIIVDYIQKVRAQGFNKRHEMISAVSEGLRELAKSENVIVLALSQLTQPEDKKKRAPRLFDYKESGDIVNDAHAVLAVYRPVNDNGSFAGNDKIIILKQRSGQVNTTVNVNYNSERLVYEAAY